MLTRITNVFINILFYLIDRNIYNGSPHIYKLEYFLLNYSKCLNLTPCVIKKTCMKISFDPILF